ncbi:MAG: hypothetical protein R3229_02245 [Alphaproteobacteria bacterium]|nr:hypothetical protein [Alphaproteobacteria bacterium]
MTPPTRVRRLQSPTPPTRAIAFALAVFAMAAMTGPKTALGAPLMTPIAAETGEQAPAENMDIKQLKERLRVLGEAIRNAIEDATRAMREDEDALTTGKGGLGALPPKVRGRSLRSIYGPKGPTVRSVRALLNYRLVLLGNERLAAGRVHERDRRIIAEVVTVRERALVARYMINKETGLWVPEQ